MLKLSQQLKQLKIEVERRVQIRLQQIEELIDSNQEKVIEAFQKHKVSDFHFGTSTGYGYNDRGREVLDLVYADIFGAESALVRPHFASGTHTIATALFGVLRPGDELLYITGTPYDTLHHVIGRSAKQKDVDETAADGGREVQRGEPSVTSHVRQNSRLGTGSLRDWGVFYRETPLTEEGRPDWEAIRSCIHEKTRVIGIQRSRGYAWRSSFTVDEIAEMVKFVKSIKSDVIVFVDNCYGEFTERREPTQAGADIIAGSLIKNPGGGLAASGGYIAGKQIYVEQAAFRLTAPGIGAEVGAMLGTLRSLYQGMFMAPHSTGQALKGSVFAAALLEEIGCEVNPRWDEARSDIIQAVRFEHKEQLIAFVQGVQLAAAVDAHVVPEPWEMPGYDHEVIMAAGTFIQGGSLELSADAPIREPYTAYIQGGLTYSHSKMGVLTALQHLMNKHSL